MTEPQHDAHLRSLGSDNAQEHIAAATRRVKTRTLSRHGIEEIRVLSESEFLRVVRRMADESTTLDGKTAATAHANAAREIREEQQRRWDRLRRTQRSNLTRLEERLTALGKDIEELESVITRTGGTGPVPAR